MKTKLLLLFLAVGTAFTACNQDDDESCLHLATTASFTVDGTAFTELQVLHWSSGGNHQQFRFKSVDAGNGHEFVSIVFEGDTVGNYPLGNEYSPHYATYSGPTSNTNVLSTGPGVTGTLTITNIDLETGCINGNYIFTANFVQVSGEFQSLRPQ